MADRTEEVFDLLYAQAVVRWGQDEAEPQRAAIRRVAQELVEMLRCHVPPDLEPRFFED